MGYVRSEPSYPRSELTSVIIRAAIEVHRTLGAGFLAGPSPKALIAEQEAAELAAREDAKRIAARLKNNGYSDSTEGKSSLSLLDESAEAPKSEIPSTPTVVAKTRYPENPALRSAVQRMRVVDDLLDFTVWDGFRIRAEAREAGTTLLVTLENPASKGRVSITISDADAQAGSRSISREECERIYQALSKGLSHSVHL